MKRTSTFLLKVSIGLIALCAVAAMIRFPLTEGRAVNLDLVSIYTDPFIIYLYVASIPFFLGLQQTYKLLGVIERNQLRSAVASKTIRTIRNCTLAIMTFLIGALGYVFVLSRTTTEDGAGPIMVGLIAFLILSVIALATTRFQKRLT